VAHFYFTPDGGLVAELDRSGYSVAVVAPTYTKTDIFNALRGLKPLR
jgi:hypothetical protein